MKNKFKRACIFYLGSWWLPPVVLGIVFILSLSIGLCSAMFINPSISGTASGIASSLPFILISMLGILSSWIWFVFRKQWRNFVLSILLVPIVIIIMSLVASIFAPVFFMVNKMNNTTEIPDAAQTQGDEE